MQWWRVTITRFPSGCLKFIIQPCSIPTTEESILYAAFDLLHLSIFFKYPLLRYWYEELSREFAKLFLLGIQFANWKCQKLGVEVYWRAKVIISTGHQLELTFRIYPYKVIRAVKSQYNCISTMELWLRISFYRNRYNLLLWPVVHRPNCLYTDFEIIDFWLISWYKLLNWKLRNGYWITTSSRNVPPSDKKKFVSV